MDKKHVLCPYCQTKRECTPYTVAYRVRQLDHVRVVCTGCGKPYKILADINYLAEK